MTKLIIAAFISLFTCTYLNGQEKGRMETDRPDQTESPYLTKHHFVQGEIGFNYEKAQGFKTFVHPTALWKYGISKKFELRLITELVSIETPLLIPDGNNFISGLLPVQLGGKLALFEEKGLVPKTSLIFHIAPPGISSRKFRASKWAPNFRFVMQNTLTENIGLGIAPGFNIGKKWYGYVEAFGAVRKNEKPEHAIDGGIAYYFSDDTKIDFSGGYGLSENAIDWYTAIGFSFRFNTKKK